MFLNWYRYTTSTYISSSFPLRYFFKVTPGHSIMSNRSRMQQTFLFWKHWVRYWHLIVRYALSYLIIWCTHFGYFSQEQLMAISLNHFINWIILLYLKKELIVSSKIYMFCSLLMTIILKWKYLELSFYRLVYIK